MSESIYSKISKERKLLQELGELPKWLTTGGYQVLNKGYFWKEKSLKESYSRIAKTAAQHAPKETLNNKSWEESFYEILWNGWLAASTPIFNMGTNKGLPVSCSGGYVPDSIEGFYSSRKETAILTKHGFGTSGYLGDIRNRGSIISSGGTASGTLPVFQMFVDDMRKVAQGVTRRGAFAGYLPIDHDDFEEVSSYLEMYPDDLNIGWIVSQNFIDKLNSKDLDSITRYQKALKIKAVTGKGYFLFNDKVNSLNPQMYKDLGLEVKASNLCTEITLFSDKDHTFTCVLSSLNLEKYDEWKDTDTVKIATVFLDCVAQEFINQAKNIDGLEKAVRFTEKSRALGLGTLGFHSYLQKNSIPFESFDAHMINNQIFSRIKKESLEASVFLAKTLGEPEWCKGYGVRNTHLLAIAPNSSSSLICGGVSQGIEPIVANSYIQPTAAGEITRLNPQLLKLFLDKGVEISDKLVESINENNGSVQHLDFLSDHEKLVFKTAYEIDQKSIIRLASARQRYICQAQSINLFFDANEDEGYISEVHQEAFLDPNIKSLYYMRTASGVAASKGVCIACEG